MPNDSLITNVCSGSHSITLTDANGCSSAIINGGNNQVVVPFALSTTASIDFSSVVNVLCNSSATGSVIALNPITNNIIEGKEYDLKQIKKTRYLIFSSNMISYLGFPNRLECQSSF